MSFSNISFILNKPQLSENIGACARALKNFNFNQLVVINPKPIFPNDKILATSVGARGIIKKTETYSNLELYLKKIDYLIATTSRFRNKNIKHITINDLEKIDYNNKIGFLFGSEASGLSNKEISYANCVLQIPCNPNFKSLNLSHSVIIICQILSSILKSKKTEYFRSKKIKTASKHEIQLMVNFFVNKLERINFFKPKEKKPIMLENLKSIFHKIDLSKKEIRILMSVFAALYKKKVD